MIEKLSSGTINPKQTNKTNTAVDFIIKFYHIQLANRWINYSINENVKNTITTLKVWNVQVYQMGWLTGYNFFLDMQVSFLFQMIWKLLFGKDWIFFLHVIKYVDLRRILVWNDKGGKYSLYAAVLFLRKKKRNLIVLIQYFWRLALYHW